MAVLPMLHFHDRNAVEVYSYADVPKPDGATAQLEQLSDHWLNIAGMSDETVADQMVHDKIDILVVLAGHMDRNRSLLRKPIRPRFKSYTMGNAAALSATTITLSVTR